MGIETPFGGRGRIGLISPTVIEMIAYDFYRVAPAGLGLCGITGNIEFWDRENFTRVLDSILDASAYLGSRRVDFVIHAGMPLVTTRGKGFEEELVQRITERTGLPSTTSIRSAIRALEHLGIERVALISPYPAELHRSAQAFLGASGFEVVAEKTMDVEFKRLQDVRPEQICGFARRALDGVGNADGVYIPCNQWAAADAAPMIEADLGLPVVSGGHADFWEAFRSVGVRDRIENHGRLMRSLADLPR
jgi:maleate isomerase